jgi:hypothetical protein
MMITMLTIGFERERERERERESHKSCVKSAKAFTFFFSVFFHFFSQHLWLFLLLSPVCRLALVVPGDKKFKIPPHKIFDFFFKKQHTSSKSKKRGKHTPGGHIFITTHTHTQKTVCRSFHDRLFQVE